MGVTEALIEATMYSQDNNRIVERISEAEKYLIDSDIYKSQVIGAINAYTSGDIQLAESYLDKLPTKQDMLNILVEKLKTCKKSISRTLKIIESKEGDVDKYVLLKALLSLGVHDVIECEKGRKEFRMVVPLIYQKVGSIIYGSEI